MNVHGSLLQMSDILDLHDLSVLLNYERGLADPLLKYRKLFDTGSESQPLELIQMSHPAWLERNALKVAFVLIKNDDEEPSTSSTLLPNPIPLNLQHLTPTALETIYHQIRNHDGGLKAVSLLQHFFDLYPPTQPLHIRTSTGASFFTTIANRVILELTLHELKVLTLIALLPENMTLVSSPSEEKHLVVGFSGQNEKHVGTVLDLASTQFGDIGGKNKGAFVLDSIDRYQKRVIEKVAARCEENETRTFQRMGASENDAWLKDVAEKVKKRWEERNFQRWCGHCGRPPSAEEGLKKCSKCSDAFYCGVEHQTLAWSFHKHFCLGTIDSEVL